MEGFVIEIKEKGNSRILDVVPEMSEDKPYAWRLVQAHKVLLEKTQMKDEPALAFCNRMTKIAKKVRLYRKRGTKRS